VRRREERARPLAPSGDCFKPPSHAGADHDLRRASALFLALFCTLAVAMPASAAPGGALRTMNEDAGPASFPAMRPHRPLRNLKATSASVPDFSYTAVSGGRGTYSPLGKILTMTGGPYAGQRFERVGGATVIRLGPDGKRLPERCVHAGAVRDAMADGAGTP